MTGGVINLDNTEILERLVKVEEGEKSAHHRLDEHETKINDLSNVYVALTKVDDKVTSVEKDVSEMKSDIKDIKDKPAKRWDTIVLALITRNCNSSSGFFLRQIGNIGGELNV